MINEKAAWIMNMAIRIALIVFLSVLALALVNGVDPVKAVVRSGTAFISFLILGWGTSMLWLNDEKEEAASEETEDGENTKSTAETPQSSQPVVGTATGMPVGAMSAPQE